MARYSFLLLTAALFATILAVASALPVAERQERHFSPEEHGDGDSHGEGESHSDGDSKGADKPTEAPKEGSGAGAAAAAGAGAAAAAGAGAAAAAGGSTTAPESGSTSAAASGEPAGEGGVTPETSGAPETSADPAAATTTAADDDADADASGSPEDADASESPEETEEDDDDGSVCFPASATVELQDGSIVPMAKLSIGDSVKVGFNQYSKVFMFTHKMGGTSHKFVVLETASGAKLSLTKGHYMYADDSLVAASQVKVGSSVTLGDGTVDTVVSVSSKVDQGLYNPQTVNGNIVVNNVLASTYTTAVEPVFAHAILSPFRFFNTIGLHFTSLESGGGVLADIAPRGRAF